MSKQKIFIFLILILGAFLRFYKLPELMPFIGDQGWFYMSARDMIVSNQIPLVGITASYTWLHQGALWTYMLVPVLWISNFNPLSGGYLSVLIGVLSVLVTYIVAKDLFNKKVAISAILLFATSPLVILSSRMPYHTSPISLLVLLFIYFIYKYSKGSVNYLILASLVLGLLYNFELATMVFWPIFFLIIYLCKKPKPVILLKSFLAFLIPLTPMIIYDLGTGKFFQTTAFFRILKLSFLSESALTNKSFISVFKELADANRQLIFAGSEAISLFILFYAVFYSVRFLLKEYKKKSIDISLVIVLASVFLPFFGIVATRTVSGAYLPMLFPGVILIVSYALGSFAKTNSAHKLITYTVLTILCLGNLYFISVSEYATHDQIKFSDRLKVAKEIVLNSDNKKYNIVAKGEGSQFSSFTKNYEYLTWWLGNGPSKNKENIVYTIEESNGKILLLSGQ